MSTKYIRKYFDIYINHCSLVKRYRKSSSSKRTMREKYVDTGAIHMHVYSNSDSSPNIPSPIVMWIIGEMSSAIVIIFAITACMDVTSRGGHKRVVHGHPMHDPDRLQDCLNIARTNMETVGLDDAVIISVGCHALRPACAGDRTAYCLCSVCQSQLAPRWPHRPLAAQVLSSVARAMH